MSVRPEGLYAEINNGWNMSPLTLLAVTLQAAGEPADLSFLAYLDVWIIGGLVMLAVVVVVGKWLYGKLRRRPDEDPYHDERYDGYEC